MDEEQNIEEQSHELSASGGEPEEKTEGRSENLEVKENSIQPEPDPQLQTTSSTLQTENMETHHPHHVTHKKKWSEYLLEFLMLFLAVFLGFVAENFREHNVENERAKELAESLYQEAYSDSINVQQKIAQRLRKEEKLIYFRDYVRDSSLINFSEKFYPSFTWSFIPTNQILFEPKDGILNQLRNSGALRYFKSNQLQNQIGALSVAIANVRTRNEQEYQYVQFYTRPFVMKFFDFRWYEEYIQHGKLSILEALNQQPTNFSLQGKIININDFNRQDAQNLAAYYLLI